MSHPAMHTPVIPSDAAAPSSSRAAASSRARCVGLVLGAGGEPGYAFHTGAMAALATTGWDPRDAELIVGTSAGAGYASLLRAGLSAEDHHARTCGQPVSDHGEELISRLPGAAWNSGAVAPAERVPRPASGTLAARGMLRWPPRPGLTMAGALPRGRRSTAPMGDRHRALHPAWPTRSLWVCSVRVSDGRRVVFGRDDHPPLDVGTAVEASSAVPGWFTPVRVGDEDYVDGGVWSMTNADLTTGLGFDALVVIAPLSTPAHWRELPRRPSINRAYRAYHRAVLDAELRRVRVTGTEVITIAPTLEDLAVLTGPDPGIAHRADIARQIYDSVCRRLEAEPALATLLTEAVAA